MNGQKAAAIVFGALVVLALGYGAGRIAGKEARVAEATHDHGPGTEAARWTCPMHPQIKAPAPGACPLCGMALVPMEAGDDPGPKRLRMSAADALLADIEVAAVERRFVTKRVRLVGELDFDETRVRTIAARVPGRLERLFVDYTGVPVREGDHLVRIYSPELFAAQEELLEAQRRVDAADPERSDFLAESDRRALASAREKLLEWGLSAARIDAVLERGTAEDRMTIDSPVRGVVVHKAVHEGDYVDTGSRLYRIADLDRLWIRLAVFEKDLPWVRYGQSVSLTTDALPGRVFEGRISFLDPVLDDKTRTVKVRAQVDNPDGLLKPGMYVRAVIDARLAQGGKVMDPRLGGKWICPMHPEVVADGASACDVCGMDLVPAAELGYVTADAASTRPLVVPYSAVLPTGRRAVVYVEVPGQEQPTFEGREIVLGPRADDDQVVLAGLEENELVVVHGAFKIDSALQIHAKPSLLTMGPGGQVIHGARDAVFLASVEPLWSAYFELGRALVQSDVAAARAGFAAVADALAAVQSEGLDARDELVWQDELRTVEAAVDAALRPTDAAALDALRAAFHDLSRAMIAVDVGFGHAGQRVHREAYCPMAFDDTGARWLQLGEEVRNPYFGDRMLTCGEFRRLLPGRGGDADSVLETGPAAGAERGDAAPAPEDRVELPAAFLDALTAVFEAAVGVQIQLAADTAGTAAFESTRAAAEAAMSRIDEAPEAERARLRDGLAAVRDAARAANAAADLPARRAAFGNLSAALLELIARYGHASEAPFAEAHCPMAFDDRGASWLQRGDEIANPYFGSEMPRCGSIERTFEPLRDPPAEPAAAERDGEPGPEAPPPDPVAALTPVYDAYLDAQEALAADDPAGAATAALRRAVAAAQAVEVGAAPADRRERLADLLARVAATAEGAAAAADLAARRAAFEPLSVAVTELHDAFGHAGTAALREAHCPMAFDSGASWLQRGEQVLNPYYGSQMLRCGEIRRVLAPRKDR